MTFLTAVSYFRKFRNHKPLLNYKMSLNTRHSKVCLCACWQFDASGTNLEEKRRVDEYRTHQCERSKYSSLSMCEPERMAEIQITANKRWIKTDQEEERVGEWRVCVCVRERAERWWNRQFDKWKHLVKSYRAFIIAVKRTSGSHHKIIII